MDPGAGWVVVVGVGVSVDWGGVGVWCVYVLYLKCVHSQITSNLSFIIRDW